MSVELELPLEIVVPGTPVSLAASWRSRNSWQEQIRATTRPFLPEGHFATEAAVQVDIYFFADAPVRFDIDNIVKPIFDALKQFVIVDDRQVERLVVQKFEPERLFTFSEPSVRLTEAFEATGPRVYLSIRVSEPGEVAI